MLKGNLLFGQSGGPTSVINASAYGVITAAEKSEAIENIYAAEHGIVGILHDRLIDIAAEDKKQIELLPQTPSSIFGSCRYKLQDAAANEADYQRILEVFQKHNIRYFFYNGGNDTMDTCNKVAAYLAAKGYDCCVAGVPKTVDNDLVGTDHCPGFASAARYIATTFMELKHDATVYNYPQVTIVEAMGRHAGWLAASAALSTSKGYPVDLIYVPESVFDLDKFTADVERIRKENGGVLVCVSEGCQTKDKKFIPEIFEGANGKVDAFGHKQLGGTASCLASHIQATLGGKVRGIELSLMQRCSAHLASATDVAEAINCGKKAVEFGLAGQSRFMVGMKRKPGEEYAIDYVASSLSEAANAEKKLPTEYINAAGNNIKPEFAELIAPLVKGELKFIYEDGLPVFAKLKKVIVK